MDETRLLELLDQTVQNPELLFQLIQEPPELHLFINRELHSRLDYADLSQRCQRTIAQELARTFPAAAPFQSLHLYSRIFGATDPDWVAPLPLSLHPGDWLRQAPKDRPPSSPGVDSATATLENPEPTAPQSHPALPLGSLPDPGLPDLSDLDLSDLSSGSSSELSMGVPTLGVPTLGIPTLGIPTLGVPTLGVPTLGVPTLGVPTLNLDNDLSRELTPAAASPGAELTMSEWTFEEVNLEESSFGAMDLGGANTEAVNSDDLSFDALELSPTAIAQRLAMPRTKAEAAPEHRPAIAPSHPASPLPSPSPASVQPAAATTAPPLAHYCFIRNRLLLTSELQPPSKTLIGLIKDFHILSPDDQTLILTQLEGYFKRNTFEETPALAEAARDWLQALQSLFAEDKRRAPIWLSRYCHNPEGTITQLAIALDPSLAVSSAATSTEAMAADSVTLDPLNAEGPNPNPTNPNPTNPNPTNLSPTNLSPTNLSPTNPSPTSSRISGHGQSPSPGSPALPSPNRPQPNRPQPNRPQPNRSRSGPTRPTMTPHPPGLHQEPAPRERSTPSGSSMIWWPIAWFVGTLIAVLLTVKLMGGSPTQATDLCKANATPQDCQLAVELVGEETLQKALTTAKPADGNAIAQAMQDGYELADQRSGRDLNGHSVTAQKAYEKRSQQVLPGVILTDVTVRDFREKADNPMLRVATVFVSEAEEGAAAAQLQPIGIDNIPPDWPTTTYQGDHFVEDITRSLQVQNNFFIRFLTVPLFTGVGLLIVGIFGIGMRFYTLESVVQVAFILGALESILFSILPTWGLWGAIALESLILLGITGFIKNFKMDWSSGYFFVACGIGLMMAIRALLNWAFFALVFVMV